MTSTLLQASSTHVICEDNLTCWEDDTFINGIISDGCSTGTNSHFASQLTCYIGKIVSPLYQLFVFMSAMNDIKKRLQLTEMNLLATCIVFRYHKSRKEFTIRCFGDCTYYVNDVEYIVDQGNKPDYIGYHLSHDIVDDYFDYDNKYPPIIYHNVDRFIVCSDGIDKIGRSSIQESTEIDPYKLLLAPPKSENYLHRMWNLIKRAGFKLSDDLSIISYTS